MAVESPGWERASVLLGLTAAAATILACCLRLASAGSASCRLLVALLPALVANGSALALTRAYSRLTGRRLTPLDMGATLGGRRLLGDGKTWEGLALGTMAGGVAGGFLVATGVVDAPLYYGLPLGLAALLGDVAGSFVKRRLGLRQGACVPLLDQLDFYAASTAAAIGLDYAGPGVGAGAVAASAVAVMGLHSTTNLLAFEAGLKKDRC